MTLSEKLTGLEMPVREDSTEVVRSSKHAQRRGMVLAFQPLSLAFSHVNYYVDMPAVSVSFLAFHSLVI